MCQQVHALALQCIGAVSQELCFMPIMCPQAQEKLLGQKAQAAELARKLAEDVAMTEELQKELTVLEGDFNAVKTDRAG